MNFIAIATLLGSATETVVVWHVVYTYSVYPSLRRLHSAAIWSLHPAKIQWYYLMKQVFDTLKFVFFFSRYNAWDERKKDCSILPSDVKRSIHSSLKPFEKFWLILLVCSAPQINKMYCKDTINMYLLMQSTEEWKTKAQHIFFFI